MDCEVTALDAVVESAVNRHVLAVFPKRLEQRRLLVRRAGGFGKELLDLIAKQIPDRDESPRAGTGAPGSLNGGIAAHGAGHERWERGEGQRCTEGFEDETTPVHRLLPPKI